MTDYGVLKSTTAVTLLAYRYPAAAEGDGTMANVWMVKEGSEPTRGGAWRVMALQECERQLGLRQAGFLSGLTDTPRFGDRRKPTGMFRDPIAVVVEVREAEAMQHGWKPGFYLIDSSPKDVEKACA